MPASKTRIRTPIPTIRAILDFGFALEEVLCGFAEDTAGVFLLANLSIGFSNGEEPPLFPFAGPKIGEVAFAIA